MADASSIRYAASLPIATGRNAGAVRYDTVNQVAVVSDGSDWIEFGVGPSALNLVDGKIAAAALVAATASGNSVTFIQSGTLATAAFFVAPAACKIVAVAEVHAVAGDDAGAVTAVVTKDTGTAAPGAGTAVTTGTFNLKGTANTAQVGTLAASGTITLARGDRLSVKLTGTATTLAGTIISLRLTWV